MCRAVTDFLLFSCETALDEELILIHWKTIQAELEFSQWLKVMYRRPSSQRLVKGKMSRHVRFGFEIIAAFLNAMHEYASPFFIFCSDGNAIGVNAY
jgi:hypothetical protein